MRLPSTVDLETFLVVVRTGSITAAASELRLSAPSVSARMNRLEGQLGAALLERGPLGTAITPAGARFRGYAERVLGILDEARLEIDRRPLPRLVVSVPASIGTTLFPLLLSRASRLGVGLHCAVAHSPEAVTQVRDGVAHLAIIIDDPELESVADRPIALAPIKAYTRRGSDGSGGTIVYRWGPAADELIRRIEDRRASATEPVGSSGIPDAALDTVLADGGCALVPAFAAAAHPRHAELQHTVAPLDVRPLPIGLVIGGGMVRAEALAFWAEAEAEVVAALSADIAETG